MSYKQVADVKQSISGILQGLNLNNVKNLNVALQRTARQVCVKLDIPETVIRSALTLYDGVTDYNLPANTFATAIIDLRPQGVTRTTTNFAIKQLIEDWDRDQLWVGNETKFTIEYNPFGNSGGGLLRVVSPVPQPKIELDTMSATTGWTAAGTASSLTLDQTVYYKAPGALRVNLTSGAGTLTKTTIPKTDFTNYAGIAMVFLAYRTPSTANLTSVQLKIGTDASNYYTVTATATFLGSFIANAWDLIAFDLSTATTVGIPTVTNITYAQITVNTSGTINNFYVGELWAALPSPHTLLYETSAIFLASGATSPSQSITADTDSVVLNDAALAIYEIEAAVEIAMQQGGTLASNMIATLDQKLNGVRGYRGVLIQPGLLDLYRADNPSQQLRPVGSYYDD